MISEKWGVHHSTNMTRKFVRRYTHKIRFSFNILFTNGAYGSEAKNEKLK